MKTKNLTSKIVPKKTAKKTVKKKAATKKTTKKTANKVGRPKFIIDYDQVEKLAMLQCTHEEIASFLNCSHDILARDERFIVVYKSGMDKGRMSLRRKQWKALDAGNTTMLIWLGKQYLGQRDKHENTVDHSGTINLSNKSDAELKKILSEV